MVQTRYVITFLFLCIFGAHGGAFLSAQELTYKFEDYTSNNERILKAEIAARLFIANPLNKKPEVLKSTYFIDAAKKEYNVGPNQKLPLGNGRYLAAAVLVAKAMRELEQDPMIQSDVDLLEAWIKKQKEVLAKFGTTPKVLVGQELIAWTQFLTQWTDDASAKGISFRSALKEAPFEIVDVMVKVKDDQLKSAGGPGGGGGAPGSPASDGKASNVGGSSFPLHERRMNHIYHYNDRRVAKAERIRSRR